ncbi:MAG: hypothetical protein WCR79_05400 [Fusobacterium sp.]
MDANLLSPQLVILEALEKHFEVENIYKEYGKEYYCDKKNKVVKQLIIREGELYIQYALCGKNKYVYLDEEVTDLAAVEKDLMNGLLLSIAKENKVLDKIIEK